MKYAFYCDRPSVTCRTLARVMGLRKLDDSDPGTHTLRQRKMRGSGWTIINYGTSYHPWWDLGVNWVNPPDSVAKAVSKLATYNRLKEEEVKSVRITDQIAVAQRWVGDGYRVLTRRDGLSQGRGIQEGIVEGPGLLYSRVFPKTHEYRVFVGGGTVLDFVEKKAPLSEVQVDRLIRSHDNGWVFAHGSLSVTPEDRASLEDLAIRATKALGLTFGAVDILACLNRGTPRRVSNAVVCEVNTAPGLTSVTTFQKFHEYFSSITK